jgi:NADP-dependent aldehyde dehydrogenase
MGWCQGRICGSAVAELTAALGGRAVSCEELVAMARCPLAQPVTLETLATLDLPDEP